MIACQLSLYPLATQEVAEVVDEALESVRELESQGLSVEVGSMSTVVTGPEDLVWRAVRLLFDAAARDSRRIVLAATLSNECGCDVPAAPKGG